MKSSYEHEAARKHGISKHLRSYAKRYGGLSVGDIVQIRAKAKHAKKKS